MEIIIGDVTIMTFPFTRMGFSSLLDNPEAAKNVAEFLPVNVVAFLESNVEFLAWFVDNQINLNDHEKKMLRGMLPALCAEAARYQFKMHDVARWLDLNPPNIPYCSCKIVSSKKIEVGARFIGLFQSKKSEKRESKAISEILFKPAEGSLMRRFGNMQQNNFNGEYGGTFIPGRQVTFGYADEKIERKPQPIEPPLPVYDYYDPDDRVSSYAPYMDFEEPGPNVVSYGWMEPEEISGYDASFAELQAMINRPEIDVKNFTLNESDEDQLNREWLDVTRTEEDWVQIQADRFMALNLNAQFNNDPAKIEELQDMGATASESEILPISAAELAYYSSLNQNG